jgi:hypothetical protein
MAGNKFGLEVGDTLSHSFMGVFLGEFGTIIKVKKRRVKVEWTNEKGKKRRRWVAKKDITIPFYLDDSPEKIVPDWIV